MGNAYSSQYEREPPPPYSLYEELPPPYTMHTAKSPSEEDTAASPRTRPVEAHTQVDGTRQDNSNGSKTAAKPTAQVDQVRRFLLFCHFVDYYREDWAEADAPFTPDERAYFHRLSELQVHLNSRRIGDLWPHDDEDWSRLQREFYSPVMSLGIPVWYGKARLESFSKMFRKRDPDSSKSRELYLSTILEPPYVLPMETLAARLLTDRDVIFETLIKASPEDEREKLWERLGYPNKWMRCHFFDFIHSPDDYWPSKIAKILAWTGYMKYATGMCRQELNEYEKRMRVRIDEETVRSSLPKEQRICQAEGTEERVLRSRREDEMDSDEDMDGEDVDGEGCIEKFDS
jgi:hypothetical protein